MIADKGNGPLRVRSFAGVGAEPVAHRLVPYRLDREAAGEIDIENIDVFIGIDVGKSEHWATALSRKVLDRALPNDEERLHALYKKLADHGNLLVVVGYQPATIGALAVAAAQDMGVTVGYLPGLSMRRIADLNKGCPCPAHAASVLLVGALSAFFQGLGGQVGGRGRAITGMLPGSSSAAALLGARPIPSIATTPGARPRGSQSSPPATLCAPARSGPVRYTASTRWATSFAHGRRIHGDGDEAVSPPALPHVPVDTEHPSSASGRVRAALSLRRDGGVGRVSANTKTSGDAGHGGVVGERRGQGPPPGPAREVVVPERLACPARVATPRAQPPPHSARAAPHPHYQTRRAQNGRFLLDGLWV